MVSQVIARISFYDFMELWEFHYLTVTEFSEDLIQWSSHTVEQFFYDFDNRNATFSLFDSK